MKPKLKKNDKNEIEGVIYMYELDMPGDPHDGWVYIGATYEEENRRNKWKCSKQNYAGEKLELARQEFGLDKFKYSILTTVYDKDLNKLQKKLDVMEKQFIEQNNSYENGFNSNHGGAGRTSFHHSEQTKQKISEAMKGKKKSDTTKNKISKANTGKKRTPEVRKAISNRMAGKIPAGLKEWQEKNPNGFWKGRVRTEESKLRMKAAKKKCAIPVIAINEDGVKTTFNSMSEASEHFGINIGMIYYSIHKGSRCKNGLLFQKPPSTPDNNISPQC